LVVALASIHDVLGREGGKEEKGRKGEREEGERQGGRERDTLCHTGMPVSTRAEDRPLLMGGTSSSSGNL
jgi:hypothetical protein